MNKFKSMRSKLLQWFLTLAAVILFQSSSMSANILQSPTTTNCKTSLTETQPYTGGFASHFNDFASQSNGGQLCPGKYSGTAKCFAYNNGGCGGSSCGWDLMLYDNAGNIISTQSDHLGGMQSYGNFYENDSEFVDVNSFTLNTAVNAGLYMSGYMQGGSYYFCTMTVYAIPS